MDRQQDDPISINPDHAKFVRRQVDSGVYQSPSDVINDGLRVLEEMDQFLRANRAAIRRKLERAAKQVERGELIDGDEVFAELEQLDRADAARAKAKPELAHPQRTQLQYYLRPASNASGLT